VLSGENVADKWQMPEWMKKYEDMIVNTGGNKVEDMYNRKINTFANAIEAVLISSVQGQVDLLTQLHDRGMLKED
jgi:hypothetical protein